MALHVAAFALASAAAAPTVPGFVEENPFGVAVTRVHAVFSNHFDAGCKTPKCGFLAEGEPDRCAVVLPDNPARGWGHRGEPWAYHVVNRYFDVFIPDAIASAAAARKAGSRFRYLIQPWVVALYVDCANAGMVSWPGSGFDEPGTPVLHCPNASSVEALRSALKSGDIYMHAFPHDGEASYYPDVTIFKAALNVSFALADELGVPRPTTVSQRDVPGWTRASLPTLNAAGVWGLSFGAGTPPGKPDTPPLFLWRDVATGAEVVVTYETGYGTSNTVFVLPTGEAFAACWMGDNTGPPALEDAETTLAQLRQRYPGATVEASTLDAFFDAANAPDVKSKLPLVTAEIGDGWIYGVPSDPLKNAQFRTACRLRRACIEQGRCDPGSPGMRAYDRLLVKVPEHTWGVAQMWFLPDYTNWTNVEFDNARAQQPFGFVKNNTNHADYNTTVNSWIEQRTFVTAGPAILEHDEPAFAAELKAELDAIANPIAPVADGAFTPVPASQRLAPLPCGGLPGAEVRFGADGSLVGLVDRAGARSWASNSNPVGQYRYQSFTNNDYQKFLADFAIRIGGGCVYQPGARDDSSCGNFRKPGMQQYGHAVHRDLTGNMTSLHRRDTATGCEFLASVAFPAEAVRDAGAPAAVTINVTMSKGRVDWDVYTAGKRPTRLAESIFFTFNPVADARAWTLVTLNHTLDPTDVFGANGTVYGGSPHLRGVERVTGVAVAAAAGNGNGIGNGIGNGGSRKFVIESLDVPIVSTGEPTPFPTPRNAAPDMTRGVSWNIFQNIWNTNYVLWYPFREEDAVTRSRFSMTFDDE